MLEIRELTKTYRPKHGVPVTAIDHISLRFPSEGMVFLLGKSGSGKSTLLNLLGGLDRFDSGEILINGETAASFRQSQYDSYRNTYVGFIFQEYNILDEFTVGANIALAIELQGKRATDDEINAILHEVDLDGFGDRRPNELSGGQKQRVAIARALVKQPRIIMADEPTGALDSVTGRQIFDTLKKLSADRLVLVVSHDREFAEQYADRIIELADGKVISDLVYTDAPAAPTQGLTFTEAAVEIAAGYHLTEEDRLAINEYLDRCGERVSLYPAAAHASGKQSAPTVQEDIPAATGGFRLIKSRLPLHCAFKIGASSLRHKRIRLVITILLSCVAFGLFGLADTFGSYNHIRSCTDSLADSAIDYAAVKKTVRGTGKDAYYAGGYYLNDDDLATVRDATGVSMRGVYVPLGWDMDYLHHLGNLTENSKEAARRQALYAGVFSGLMDVTAPDLADMGYDLLAGRLPDGNKDEIAISEYCYSELALMGYRANMSDKTQTVPTPADMIGKTLVIQDRPFTVTGVIDTHFDLSRYEMLTQEPEHPSTTDTIIRFALAQELEYARSYSFHTVMFTGEGYTRRLIDATSTVRPLTASFLYFADKDDSVVLDPYYIGSPDDLRGQKIVWLDGKERTELGEKELVISPDLIGMQSDAVYEVADKAEPDIEEPFREEDLRAWLEKAGTLRENSSRCYADGEYQPIEGYTVVGYLSDAVENPLHATVLTATSLRNALTGEKGGVYEYAAGAMPDTRDGIKTLVSYCYNEDSTVHYELQNAATYELDIINETLETLSVVFLYIGLGFALFAALMLANFISTSIHYKKQEIGILRAIGSRSNDVFRIFFAESFIIAMINFVLSGTAVGVVTAIINRSIRTRLGVLVTVLGFGVRQIVLLLAVSLLVAVVASFFPVRRIAAKRPIDAIRGK